MFFFNYKSNMLTVKKIESTEGYSEYIVPYPKMLQFKLFLSILSEMACGYYVFIYIQACILMQA